MLLPHECSALQQPNIHGASALNIGPGCGCRGGRLCRLAKLPRREWWGLLMCRRRTRRSTRAHPSSRC